jgi:hypothetical protein
MKQKIQSVLSFLTIILFLGMSMSSFLFTRPDDPCDTLISTSDLVVYDCKPLDPPIEKNISYQLTLRDKSTGEALSGISYTEVLYVLELSYEICYNNCEAFKWFDGIRVQGAANSDINGMISIVNPYETFKFSDELDKIMFKILIRDNSGIYAPKTVYLHYLYTTSPIIKDVFLINNNEL